MARPVTISNVHSLGIKPGMLTGAAARQNLDLEIPEFRHVVLAIEKHGALWEGLHRLRSIADSRMTREARAERYAAQRAKAIEFSCLVLNNARADLAKRRDRLRNEAINKSGLADNFPQGEEVRRALRELPQAERDKAIQEAVDGGDAWIVSSVVRFPDLLTGKTALSKVVLTDLFIKQKSPELNDQLAEIDSALQHLKLAEDTFTAEAERMRDVEAEERAAEDARAMSEAEAAFAKAVGAPEGN